MKPRGWWYLGGTLASVAIAGTAVWWLRPVPVVSPVLPEPRYEIPKTVSYSFTLKNKSGRLLEHAELWAYAPVKQTSSQYCCDRLDASQPYELETDRLGNQALHFRLPPLPPFASRVVRITAELRLADQPNPLPQESTAPWLGAEPLVESRDPRIRAKAVEMLGADPLATARRVHTWVAEHVRDTGYLRQDRGALYALQKQQGDCTENMDLFMALTRANGIPAKGFAGYVLAGNGVLHPEAYHNWAEFNADGVWRIADPHGRVFSDRYPSYVAMRAISAVKGGQFPADRFWTSGDGLDVKMN